MKLYNLWRVRNDGGRAFVMLAPLDTIVAFLRLRREAEARVVQETDAGGLCHLFGREDHHVVGLTKEVMVDETD